MFVIVGNSGRIITSPNGSTWTEQNSTVGGSDLSSIVYRNELFVSVGGSGTIITSPDGTTWTKRTSSAIGTFFKIIHAKEMFVAVGNDGIYTSPNCTGWLQRCSCGNK
jgi:photosystem II stability/assembly factor-like uncharacterized protein